MLQLSYCLHMSDKVIVWVLQCCPSLEELNLSGCACITDQTCKLLAAKQVLLAQPAQSSMGAQGQKIENGKNTSQNTWLTHGHFQTTHTFSDHLSTSIWVAHA